MLRPFMLAPLEAGKRCLSVLLHIDVAEEAQDFYLEFPTGLPQGALLVTDVINTIRLYSVSRSVLRHTIPKKKKRQSVSGNLIKILWDFLIEV